MSNPEVEDLKRRLAESEAQLQEVKHREVPNWVEDLLKVQSEQMSIQREQLSLQREQIEAQKEQMNQLVNDLVHGSLNDNEMVEQVPTNSQWQATPDRRPVTPRISVPRLDAKPPQC